ncbi:HNH endonuclease [Shouchella patagoniensis]|uniref:HNH endonuclease n=1 Tax=Shouchella patagoniensis TaxID=228576 RepID=UPI001FE698A1|nr:HNH endonuclease [Shouchella patagoniensis]
MEQTYFELKYGVQVSNEKISQLFKCSNQGGMRRSLKTNSLILISDKTKLYHDREEEKIFYYTGMGKKGNQSLHFQQNKTLAESQTNGVDIHLFVAYKKRIYTYKGQYELVEDPYQEEQKDEDGNVRQVWIFPLRRRVDQSKESHTVYQLTNEKKEKQDTWDLIGKLAVKEVDHSALTYGETVIPKRIRPFFDSKDLKQGKERAIKLQVGTQTFIAKVRVDSQLSARYKMRWETAFTQLLNESSIEDEGNKLKIVFLKQQDDIYWINLSMIESNVIEADTIAEEIEEYGAQTEGAVVTYYGKRYERDSYNRELAIRIHGSTCVACHFNYEEMYGPRGKDYIEIHHKKPLSTIGGETEIDPKKDLVPLCANCHRMIHRRKDEVLSVEELREMIKKYKSKK